MPESSRKRVTPAKAAIPRKKAARPVRTAAQAPAAAPLLPVAGIVASAGGLEALKGLFKAMPPDSGIAFVIVPHLDPDHESLMAPLLAKQTTMPVTEAQHGETLLPNHVYVIPPNNFLGVIEGRLQLTGPMDKKSPETAMDRFLVSLADDQKERAVCIILSGTGTHGCLGLQAVKSGGGMVMAQDPTDAKYVGMPQSAIDTGLVDYVLPAAQMAETLVAYTRQLISGIAAVPNPELVLDDLAPIIALLRVRTNFDFRAYRKPMLLRRIQRRMSLSRVDGFKNYLAFLRQQPEEVGRLAHDLLISVTSFFRDAELFDAIRQDVLVDLLRDCGDDRVIRAWVPGCATGEEAYSLGMLILDHLASIEKNCQVQIFATDVDNEALEKARRGFYPESLLATVPRRLRERFFIPAADQGWQVSKHLRDAVIFANQNVLSDAPFNRIDLVSCRNLLIYLEPEIQHKVIRLFGFALNRGGYLVLGPSESLGPMADAFETVSKKWRIFRHLRLPRREEPKFPIVPSLPQSAAARPAPELPVARGVSASDAVKLVLLEEFIPASMLVNRAFEVQQYYGPTHLYARQPAGLPTQDLRALVLRGLRSRVQACIEEAYATNRKASVGGIPLRRDGTEILVRISALPLYGPAAVDGMALVVFEDEGKAPQVEKPATEQSTSDARIRELEYELVSSREDLQSGIEELKASNEEVMSMNEELQSANEELETSKEELQSLNEELTTVNSQLRDKMTELESANDDMANLFANVTVAMLVLGPDHTIRRFTPAATRLFNLIPGDIGRPISDLSARFSDAGLENDIDAVLQDLTPRQVDVQTRDGKWYQRNLMPYRTGDSRISGVVLSFTDVHELKQSEADLERRVEERARALTDERNFVESILDTAETLILVADIDLHMIRFNKACEKTSGYTEAEVRGKGIDHFLLPEELPGIRAALAELQKTGGPNRHENHWRHRDGSLHLISWSNSTIKDDEGKPKYIIATGIDITERRQLKQESERRLEDLAHLHRLHTAGELATMIAHDVNQPLLAITSFSEAALSLLKKPKIDTGKLSYDIEQISQQALRAGHTIQQLRQFVTRGKIKPVPVDLNRIVVDVVNLFRGRIEARGINVRLALGDGLPRVLGVDVHIEQVLLNLLRNALDALRDGHVKNGEISLATRRNDGMVEVMVSDNGPGISAAEAEKLFEPFFTSKHYGLGIGLRICRSLVDAHGGHIWVEPQTRGACFRFTLPVVP